MQFQRVSLKNWKNFRVVDDVALRDRVFLIGPNASGKSNFLDAILFLRQVSVTGLREAVETRGGVSKIRSLHARKDPEVAISVVIGDPDEEPWEYELVIGQDNQRLPVVRSERVSRGSTLLLSRPNDRDAADRAQLSQTYLEQITQNQAFRPVSDFLRSVLYMHLVPQIIRDPRAGYSRKDDPFGADFLERVSATQARTRDARLRRIGQILQIAVPQLRNLVFVRDPQDGTPHIEATFEHWRPNAGRQREVQFSDGTLRLIGLLWAIQDGNGPVLLEEPELSLNSAIVRQIPQLFHRMARARGVAPRQVIATTHSFDLLSDPGIDPSEVLVLTPEQEGTRVRVAAQIEPIRALVEGGLSVADAALPYTEPENAFQLVLL